MESRNWKHYTKETQFTIKRGRYWLKLKNGEEIYDDFKYRGSFGWGFSEYAYSIGIVEYAEF